MEKPFPAYQGTDPYVFVCYAHEDSSIVYPEIVWLHEQGINLWYDEGISAGKNWRAAIGESLLGASRVLFYISKQSLESDHCDREINLALDKGKEIIPVYLEDVELTPDLMVGLTRVQALHRDQDASYQQHLLNALGQTKVDELSIVVPQQQKRSWGLYAGVVLVATVLIGGGWWYTQAARDASNESAIGVDDTQDVVPTVFDPSIAVLPFRTLSTDPAVLTLADGLVDELVNELSGPRLEPLRRMYPLLEAIPLKVAPVTSTRRYRNTNEDPASIGKSLGVAYLVDGSVRPGDGQLRVTLQMMRTADDEQVWSHIYDRALGDPLAVQVEIARHAAYSVTATIPNDFWYRSIRGQFTDASAHRYFVRAHRGHLQRLHGDDVDLISLVRNYEKSLELDHAFIYTYVYLIDTYLDLMSVSIEPIETVAPIDELLTQMNGLADSLSDDESPYIRTQLASMSARYSLLQFDYVNADRYARQALDENPNSIGGHTQQGLLSLHRGDLDAARASFRRAIDVGGAIPGILLGYARLLQANEQHDAVTEFIGSVLDLVPGPYGKGRLLLDQAAAYTALGQLERATKLVDQAWALCGLQHPEIFSAALAKIGRVDRARAILHELEAGSTSKRLDPVEMISAYVALDDLDSAFRWIDKGLDVRHFGVVTWMHYPHFDQRLIDDPRWQQALSRLPEVSSI